MTHAPLSERTKGEMKAGAYHRLLYTLSTKNENHPAPDFLTKHRRCVALEDINHEAVTLRVTSPATGESTTITEPTTDFPSDALLTQISLVCE